MQRSLVRPYCAPVTEHDAREMVAKTLLKLCSAHGPTRVARAAGCDEKTIRKARDEQSTLRLEYLANLLAIDGDALEPMLNHFGRRSVPIGSNCDTDTDRSRQSKVLAAALALSVALEDDGEVTPLEVRQNHATIVAARDSLNSLLRKIVVAA